MGCLGVHFAIEPELMQRLLDAGDDEQRMLTIEEIEEGDEHADWSCDSDKAWDGVHRCLTDGRLEWANGSFPLSHVILGGEQLYEGEDYIICLARPEEVSAIATALQSYSHSDFLTGYAQIPPGEYDVEKSEEDQEYLWETLQDLKPFFAKAASAGRAVIFTADQ